MDEQQAAFLIIAIFGIAFTEAYLPSLIFDVRYWLFARKVSRA